MLFPLVVGFVSVLLGAWLALGPEPGTRLLGWIRVGAIVTALGIIAGHLLPEALHTLGLVALAGFGAGALVPSLAEAGGNAIQRRGAHAHDGHGALAALELGYAGLVVHRFGDGLSMGAYARTSDSVWAMAGVILALAAHIVPVTTVMILAVLSLRGRRAAVAHAAGLAASIMAGVVVAGAAIHAGESRVSAWISAVVAGLLLHIVGHEARTHQKSPDRRAAPGG